MPHSCKRCRKTFESARRNAGYCNECRAMRKSGVQYEYIEGQPAHRVIMLREYGPGPHQCYWCAARTDKWQVDHLDDDGENNSLSNMVFSCGDCNKLRGRLMIWICQMPPSRLAHLQKLMDQAWQSGQAANILAIKYVEMFETAPKQTAKLLLRNLPPSTLEGVDSKSVQQIEDGLRKLLICVTMEVITGEVPPLIKNELFGTDDVNIWDGVPLALRKRIREEILLLE